MIAYTYFRRDPKSLDKMGDPPELSIEIPQEKDIKCGDHPSSENFVIDFLLLTAVDCEFRSCYYYLQEPLKYYDTATGNFVYVGKMGDGIENEKLTIGLMQCDMGSGVGGSTNVQSVVTTLKAKGVLCVGFCGGLNAEKAKLGDVVVSDPLTLYAPGKVTEAGTEQRGSIVPLNKRIKGIMKDAKRGWDPPLKNREEAGPKVVTGKMLSGPKVVNSKEMRDELLKSYPNAIAIEMEGEGKISFK